METLLKLLFGVCHGLPIWGLSCTTQAASTFEAAGKLCIGQQALSGSWLDCHDGTRPQQNHTSMPTSTPQLPFKTPQVPSNRDYKALNRGTLGGLGIWHRSLNSMLALWLDSGVFRFAGDLAALSWIKCRVCTRNHTCDSWYRPKGPKYHHVGYVGLPSLAPQVPKEGLHRDNQFLNSRSLGG